MICLRLNYRIPKLYRDVKKRQNQIKKLEKPCSANLKIDVGPIECSLECILKEECISYNILTTFSVKMYTKLCAKVICLRLNYRITNIAMQNKESKTRSGRTFRLNTRLTGITVLHWSKQVLKSWIFCGPINPIRKIENVWSIFEEIDNHRRMLLCNGRIRLHHYFNSPSTRETDDIWVLRTKTNQNVMNIT